MPNERKLATDIHGTAMPIDELMGAMHSSAGSDAIERVVDATLTKFKTAGPLDALPPRERDVLRFRFGLIDGKPRSLRQTGEEMGFSASTAKRVEQSALSKLKKAK